MKFEFVEVQPGKISNILEYLNEFGYHRPRAVNDNIYEVDSIGMDLPEIQPLERINVYGKLITQLRNEKDMDVSDLADIMLITPERLRKIEAGQGWFADSELNICANVLGVSVQGLKQGQRREKVNTELIDQTFREFVIHFQKAQKSEAFMLKVLQELAPPIRYSAKYETPDTNSQLQEYGFAVYDSKEDTLVRNSNGTIQLYSTAKEALDAARQMDREYTIQLEQPKTEEEEIKDWENRIYVVEKQGQIHIIDDEALDISGNGIRIAYADRQGDITYLVTPDTCLERACQNKVEQWMKLNEQEEIQEIEMEYKGPSL